MSYEKDYLMIKSKTKYRLFLCLYYLALPFCKMLYGSKKKWVICERGNDAQDNGFLFFKYLIDYHPEIKPIYLINKNSPDYEKVKEIGKVVHFGSLKHLLLVIGSHVKISSHLFGYAPWENLHLFYRRTKTKDIHVFLQHGIIKNTHRGLFGPVCKSLKLFVCGAKPEYDFINDFFEYHNDVPQYVGLARYDYLNKFKTINQIVLMPTWRMNLVSKSDQEFLKSDFYIQWSLLIKDPLLNDLCKKNNLTVVFYLHQSLQKFLHLFIGNEIVKIASYSDKTVQDLLKESKILVTDFSSVYFDFAYMHKPLVYFQFDEYDYFKNHYEKGYFDYRINGFGDVCNNIDDVVCSLSRIIDNNYEMSTEYKKRITDFFVYNDDNNCERIYNRIAKLLTKND